MFPDEIWKKVTNLGISSNINVQSQTGRFLPLPPPGLDGEECPQLVHHDVYYQVRVLNRLANEVDNDQSNVQPYCSLGLK